MLRIGEVVDKYRIEALVGQGGMAAVYRARHVTLDSLHAVKILFITAPSVRQRLIREGRVQANLRHPNIVAVTDVLEVMGAPALVMEYIDGPALDRWLLDNEPTLEEALFLFRGILRGMMAAHERGVVHRDLKPANVMLLPTNEGVVPKITDFGLVKSLGDQKGKTQTGMAMGTPEYMAPEQIRDASDVDQRVDMFALGCILYELVCHRRAFAGPDNVSVFNAIVAGTYPPPRKFVADLPRNVHEAIRTLLEPDRDQRLSSCTALFDLLYEEHTVGRLGAMRAEITPIRISGTLPELPPATPTPPPPVASPPTPVVPEDEPSRHWSEHDSEVLSAPNPVVRLGVPLAVTLLGGVLLGGAVFGTLSLFAEPEVPAVEAGFAPSEPAPAELPEAEVVEEPAPVEAIAPVAEPTEPPPKPTPTPPKPPAKPAPPPRAEPERASGAVVVLRGDAEAAWLVAGDRRLDARGTVPAGTYRVLADFGAPEPASAGSVTLRDGERVTLECSSFLFQCRRR